MKVAMLGWEYPPFKVGGLGTHCYGLTHGLAEKNVHIDFYMPKLRQKVKSDNKNIKIIEHAQLPRMVGWLRRSDVKHYLATAGI